MAAQPCPCSSFIFFSHLNIPTYRVQTLIFPRPRSLSRRRLTAHAARRSGGGRRPWDSNAESVRGKRFESSPDDDEGNESGLSGILEHAIDSIWIFKVFKSFGWLLPAVVLSALFTTGAKAFLTALAVSVGLSAILLAIEKLSGLGDSKQKRRKRRAARARRGEANRQESKGYHSSVAVENGSSSSAGEGEDGDPSYGGWEELIDRMEYERLSSPTSSSSSSRRSTMGKDQKRRVEVGTRSKEPLLLRLLVSIFPILGSWTKLFW